MDTPEQYINAVKAAELLHISYKTMLRWIKAGRVRAFEKRYDYENAEFLIPLEEIERLRAALTMSQRELVTRFLKIELDTQDLARRLLFAESQILALRTELSTLQTQLLTPADKPYEPPSEEDQPTEEQETGKPLTPVRPLDLLFPVAQTRSAPSLGDLPPGSVRLIAFLRDHGVPTTTGLDHLVKARIEPLLLDRGAKDQSRERWLSPDQQGKLIIYWDSANKKYTPCPECPHYTFSEDSESTEHEQLHQDTQGTDTGEAGLPSQEP